MSHLLCPADFDKLAIQLREYYGEEEVKTAIHSLLQFYEDEAFDNEDITNDWIPGDFKNCDGIDRFMHNLNYPEKIDNKENKQVLFNWFCHWLLPNIPQPPQPPHHAIANTTSGPLAQLDTAVVAVADRFKLRLPGEIDLFTNQPQLANDIYTTFLQYCREQEYITIEDLLSDLDPDNIDDSGIIDEIMDKHPECNDDDDEKNKQEIFNLLYDIVTDLAPEALILKIYNNYPPFRLSDFEWEASEENWQRTNQLCTQEIPSFFKNPVEQQQPEEIKSTEDKNDWALMSAKALDFQNRFSFLMNIIDAFARYRAEENCKFWCNSTSDDVNFSGPDPILLVTPTDQTKAIQHPSVLLTPTDWLKRGAAYDFYNYVHTVKPAAAENIASAMESMLKRSLHRFNLNHVMGNATIYDDYSIFCLYTCAMNKHVYQILDLMHKAGNEHLPLQIDFWIIPRLTKKNVHTDYQMPSDLHDVTWTTSDNDDQEADIKECDPDIQELGKSDQNGKIWDLKDNLHDAGYREGVDYWWYQPSEDTIGDYSENTLMGQMRHLWSIHDSTNVQWKYTRYARYVMIIDRRNPEHIANDTHRMCDDTHKRQHWSDRMYLIRPKLKEANIVNEIRKSNNYNKIAEQYAIVLNETFIGNTKEYLFPMPRLQRGNYSNDFGGLDAGNGYKFVVSFHLHFSNKVKMYWYYGQGAMRFFMKDVCWLWPRYFKLEKDSFQMLNDDAKVALHEAINQYPLRDLQFDEFVKQLNQIS